MSALDPIVGLRNGFNSLTYPRICEPLPLLDKSIIDHADIVAFGSVIPSQKSACIAGQNCPNKAASEQYVRAMSQIGVLYACLLLPNDEAELWSLDTGNDPAKLNLERIKSARIDKVVSHLVENTDIYSSEKVIDRKYRSLRNTIMSSKPWQLSFASAGLLDLQEEQNEDSLVKLLCECISYALKQWTNLEGCPDDAHIRVGSAFIRLVTTRSLIDKGICKGDISNIDACISSAREFLPSFMNANSMPVPPDIINALWRRLQEVRFELLTGDMLAGIYEKGLLSTDEQRKNGIHYTPHSLRRLLWNAVIEHLGEVDPSRLRILDPTCGSGGFLLTAYDSLIRMNEESIYKPHNVAMIRQSLMGVDMDPFACDIARLALILQSNPTSNNWLIEQSDILQWTPLQHNQPNIIIGNPPFKLAADIFLRSIQFVAPHGLIGMVMPKSFLSSTNDEIARNRIIEFADLIGVIEFPDRIFHESQASTCAIIARRHSHESDILPRYFDYLALDRSIQTDEQKRRFLIGDWGFAKTPLKLSDRHFIDGNLELPDLWKSIHTHLVNDDIAEFHKGIILRGEKPDKETAISTEVADVRDSYNEGYLPFLANARDFISPFFIKNAKYLEWAPKKMYRSGRLEYWQPDKVVIGRCVTHKQRWRIKGAVDKVGFVYDSRIIGCIPKKDWSSYALLVFLTSSYANAWYSSHSQHGDITLITLKRMPVPDFTEDQLEHLSALGEAISRCAEISAKYKLDGKYITFNEYICGILLNEVDELVFDAFGLEAIHKTQIREFMKQAGEQRPGLFESMAIADPVEDRVYRGKPLPLYETTGIILAINSDVNHAILWIDGLELAVPVMVSIDEIPNDLRRSGEFIKVKATLTATKKSQLNITDISPHPTASLSRFNISSKIAELISRTPSLSFHNSDHNDA